VKKRKRRKEKNWMGERNRKQSTLKGKERNTNKQNRKLHDHNNQMERKQRKFLIKEKNKNTNTE
jgi:hypothetical protein